MPCTYVSRRQQQFTMLNAYVYIIYLVTYLYIHMNASTRQTNIHPFHLANHLRYIYTSIYLSLLARDSCPAPRNLHTYVIDTPHIYIYIYSKMLLCLMHCCVHGIVLWHYDAAPLYFKRLLQNWSSISFGKYRFGVRQINPSDQPTIPHGPWMAKGTIPLYSYSSVFSTWPKQWRTTNSRAVHVLANV